MATGQANAETATDHCVSLTCNNEAPIICAGFSGGQGAKAGGIGYREEVSPTIRSAESGSNQVPDILCQYGDVAGALTARHDSSPCADRGMSIVYENHAQDSLVKPCGECSPQINAKSGTGEGNLPLVQEAAIAIAENTIGRKENNGGNGTGAQEDLSYTQNATGVMGVCTNATVRRLLPIECERLMGFPDNWTRIAWKGKPEEQCPDSPRYKACGNSMCVNVMRWIGMRIEYVERRMNSKARGGGMKMKCDFCNQEFPAEELERVEGALHDSGDVEKYHVCETCAAWIDENTGRKLNCCKKCNS